MGLDVGDRLKQVLTPTAFSKEFLQKVSHAIVTVTQGVSRGSGAESPGCPAADSPVPCGWLSGFPWLAFGDPAAGLQGSHGWL